MVPFKPSDLKRYRDIAALLIKYRQGALLKDVPVVDDPLEYGDPPPVPPEATEFVADLEKLGPTFIKLGQLLSTRADFIPAPYMEALARLQDRVEPFPFSEVEAIVSVEIGARISKAFTSFEHEPMASASLGQVHHATLRDGREVAVKVQRPNIREQVAQDLVTLSEVAQLIDNHTDLGRKYEFANIIEELRKTILQELDYRLEAENLRMIAENMASFERLVIPLPVDDYSSGRVLTMDFIPGVKITKINRLVKLDIDGQGLAGEIFRAYLQQILVDGFFHADPHPGNIFLTDNHCVALLDLGMVGRIGSTLQEQLLKLLLAISEGQGDKAADVAIKIGDPREDFDELKFRHLIGEVIARQGTSTIEQMEVGKVLIGVTQIAGECNIRLPAELTLLGKTLLNLDLVGRTLDPEFDPNESIRRNAVQMMQQRTVKSVSAGNLLAAFLEAKELIEKLPGRVNQFMELVSSNKLRLKIDTIDEDLLMAGLQKIANRITLGLILASLILGAALLMRIETSFRLFGYPGFAIIFFLGATAGALVLVYSILKSDRPGK